MDKKYVVSWSGGKDSTYMLHYLLENNYPVDEVVCCDTTIEFPDMYKHQQEVVSKIKSIYPNIIFTFLKPDFDFEHYMFNYQKKRGSNAGKCGLGWSNPNYIWCRKYLKLDVIRDYCDNKFGKGNYFTYIGIAFDEYDRYDFSNPLNIYPLILNKITELECLHGCWSLGYDFFKLYDKFFRVSCWCCPLQSIKDLYMLYSFYPKLWDKLKEYDNLQNNRFRKDYSISELESLFESKHFDITKVSEP